jgi:hypothetical protein
MLSVLKRGVLQSYVQHQVMNTQESNMKGVPNRNRDLRPLLMRARSHKRGQIRRWNRELFFFPGIIAGHRRN